MRTFASITLALPLVVVGCGDAKDTSAPDLTQGTDPTGTGGGGGDGGGGDGGGGTDSATDTAQGQVGSPPTVQGASALCYLNDSDVSYYFWLASATADDPDGLDTLAGLGSPYESTVTVLQGGSPIADYPLVCHTKTGECSTSFNEDDHGVICTDASSYTFRFVVYDEDGNASAPIEAQGQQG